jgi:hypothetical protein
MSVREGSIELERLFLWEIFEISKNPRGRLVQHLDYLSISIKKIRPELIMIDQGELSP